MRRHFPPDFVFQVFSLLIAILVVHALYVAIVRPQAREVLEQTRTQSAAQPRQSVTVEPSAWVILKDPEQEISIIFAIWACAIMGYKFRAVGRERRLFDAPLVSVNEGESILPEDARAHSRAIESLPEQQRESLLPRLYLATLKRFRITQSVQDAADETRRVAETANDGMDADLAMVRYICWAIPSIGFVGTVRGIGVSLGQVEAAMQGDMSGVTSALGLAFNSTLVALLLSLLTVFLLYQLQRSQERLVLDAQADCERKLVENLQAPA